MLPAILKSLIVKSIEIKIENGYSIEKALDAFNKISDDDKKEISDMIKNKRGELYGI